MTIDWTINAGNVVTGAVAAGAFFWGGARLYGRLVAIEGAIIQHAQKLNTLDDRMLELVKDFAGVLGALNPTSWVQPKQQPHTYAAGDPTRLP